MLTGPKIMEYVEEQANLGHSVKATLRAMGFEPEDAIEELEAICSTTTLVGLLNLSGREIPPQVAPEHAIGAACSLEALLIGLAAGYALGLRDQETPFDG